MPKNPLVLGGRNFHLSGFEAEKNITITDISGKKVLHLFIHFCFVEIGLMRHLQLFQDQEFNAKMIVTEDEWMPFRRNNFDAAISCLNSHWIENLKGNIVHVKFLDYNAFTLRLWTSSALYS